jgi:hypothetical protein
MAHHFGVLGPVYSPPGVTDSGWGSTDSWDTDALGRSCYRGRIDADAQAHESVMRWRRLRRSWNDRTNRAFTQPAEIGHVADRTHHV